MLPCNHSVIIILLYLCVLYHTDHAPGRGGGSSHSEPLLLDSSPSKEVGAVNEASKKLFKSMRLSKKKHHSSTKEKVDIDLDTYKELPKDRSSHAWIDELHLMDTDKTVVLSGDWINAAVINASQYILNKQFKAKFQDVGYGMTMSYSIVESVFTQIIHDSNRNHWVTISNLDSSERENVFVFDSMFSRGSSSMKAQVACLLHTSKSEFTLNFVDVHKQTGSNDCGLFSIAYAVALCLGKNPSTVVFDQPKMRSHLISCIEQQNFSLFPVRSERRKKPES